VAQLLELATLNARNNASLLERIAALESEPVVTTTLGGSKQFTVPRLPNMDKIHAPVHISSKVKAAQQMNPAAESTNPALQSLAASQSRQGQV